MLDLIIKNGVVIDGTGKNMFRNDIGIVGDRIKKMGNLEKEEAKKVIDAEGYYVTPGFIDVNNHSDTYWRIFINPDLESLLYQGVTTIVGGNCGSSLAPILNEDMFRSIQKWIDISSLNLNWLTVKDFFNEISKIKLATNFATLVGHATLRRGIKGDNRGELTEGEMNVMLKILRKALKEGALGVSFGLVYTHAQLASQWELFEVAKVVAKEKKILAVHIREESERILSSIQEVLDIASNTGVNLQISHLKIMGEDNWKMMDEVLQMIAEAYRKGIKVAFDMYPYTMTGSVLYALLPKWVAEGGRKMMLKRLRDPFMRSRVVREMMNNSIDYSNIIISISPLNKSLTKRKVSEIADAQRKSVEEAIIDILLASNGRVITMMNVLSENNIQKELVCPLSIISSNGAGYNEKHKSSGELVHPRSFGTFPRILNKYVRNQELLTWEEAVFKMSGFPAKKYDIHQRGTLKKNNFADIVIWDPNRIEDLAMPNDPYHYSKGVEYLLVNGKIVIAKRKYLSRREGKIITKT